MARQSYAHAAGRIQATGAHIRQDDVVPALQPVLEVTPELRRFLDREQLRQRYWYQWFAELVIDRLWDELNRPFNLASVRREMNQTLQPGDDPEAALAGGVYLANRRASVLRRLADQPDLEYVLAIFCWWPFKTPPAPDVRRQLVKLRQHAFQGAKDGDFRLLDKFVPRETLVGSFDDLATWQSRSVTTFLRADL